MRLPRWRPRLRARIIAWSFVPTVVILAGVALVVFLAYDRSVETTLVQNGREAAGLAAARLASEMNGYVELLDSLARTDGMRDGDATTQSAVLAEAGNRLVVFDGGVIVLDARGAAVAAQPERAVDPGTKRFASPHLTEAYNHVLRSAQPVFSDIVLDETRAAEVVSVAVPILGGDGEFKGVLLGEFSLGATAVSAFYGDIVKIRIGRSGGAYLADGSGRLIYSPDEASIGDALPANSVSEDALAGNVGAVRTSLFDGRDVVAGYAPVAGTPWVLVTAEEWESLSGSTQGYRRFLMLLLALGVVAPAVVVTLGVRRVTQPVQELTRAAQRVAAGDFENKVAISTGDELQELGEQFNRMSDELRDSYADLDRRVADRTRKLATLNAVAAVVSGSLDLERILRDSLEETRGAMAMEAGAAYRVDGEPEGLELIVAQGFSEAFREEAGALPTLDRPDWLGGSDDGPTVRRLGGRVERVQEEGVSGRVLEDALRREGLALAIGIPLTAKGRTLGTMLVGTQKDREITSDELSLLGAVGNQIGVAMDSARLYEEAESAAASAERSRLARDLHDAVSQTLFSAALIADVLPRIWQRDEQQGLARLAELRRLTRGALAEMRTLLLELRPSALIETEPGDLLRQLAEATTERSGIPTGLVVDGQRALPPEIQVALYRIAQEALNNVVKHSKASRVSVAIELLPEWVKLTVEDDGVGFDPGVARAERMGLTIMRERAESAGIDLEVQSASAGGTMVTARWTAPRGEA